LGYTEADISVSGMQNAKSRDGNWLIAGEERGEVKRIDRKNSLA
jgi:hypothetical protein